MLIALAVSAGSTNSPWFARVWQSDEGLPDNTVVGVEQTRDGFLWVGTQGGLVRFDGLQFRQFAPVTVAGVPTSLVQAIMVDRRGRLWVAKDQRVVICVDQGKTSVFGGEPGLPNVEARVIVEDSEGGVWVSYIGGDVLRIHNGDVRSFTAADGLSQGGTCQLACDQAGQIWYAQANGLGVFRDGGFRELDKLRAQRIASARAGGIWVCTGPQLYRYKEGSPPLKVGELPARTANANPTVLYEDRSGKLWIGTREAGLFSYDGTGFETVITSHHEILSVKEDREGNFWVGTRGGGLNRLKPRVVDLLAIDPIFPFEAVRSVCEDSSSRLWAVLQNGVVSRVVAGGWKPLTTNEGWAWQYAQCIAPDPNGGVWIGTQYKGLHHWKDGAVKTSLYKTDGLGGDFVNALLTTPSGDVWIATETVGAQQHAVQRRVGFQLRTFELPPRSGLVAAMTMDAGGDCWVATSGGLLMRVHGDTLIDETRNTLQVPQMIRCLYAAADGSLWIGYAGAGLGRLKGGRFTRYLKDQGLHDDYISQVISDGRGRLWFAGNRGIFSAQEKDFAERPQGAVSRIRAVAYGQNEGLPRLQASHDYWPGALRSKDGRLWIAMQSGLAVVHAAQFEENLQSPTVIIERVSVNGTTVAAYDPGTSADASPSTVALELHEQAPRLRLPPGQRQVDFAFTALSFTMPESIAFKYRLQGLAEDWVDAGPQRVASYPRIPPGDYRFQVIACNSDGVWNETGAALAFSAVPFWWQTKWFRIVGPLAGFVLLGGSVLLGVRRRHRRQIERLELERGTERERARIAQDLHDDLGAGLTQISLNTAMVQNPVISSEIAGGLLHEIDQRSRELVTALDEIVWAINPKNDTVPSLARYLCQFAQNCLLPGGITCRLEIAPVLPEGIVGAEQRHHLFLAFKEALHNVLRHSGAKELRLSIAGDGHTICVTLTDDGCGFVPGPTPEGADGLGNMRDRMERLGGTCSVSTEPGKGTTVMFRLPLGSNAF